MWVLYAIFGFAMIWIVRSYSGSDPVKTEWLTVKESMIPDGDVERITYVTNEYRAEVYIKKDSLPKYVNNCPNTSTNTSAAGLRRPVLTFTS